MKNSIRYIVVTGATGGIGNAIIKQAIASGFTIIATGDNQERLTKLQKQFGKDVVITYKIDLSDLDAMSAFKRFVKKETHGKIEWLIHSAGFIDTREPVLRLNKQIIAKTFLINTESVIALTYLLLPLINNNGGTIFISSTASLWGNPQYPIYSASKAALNTFAQSIARHVAKGGQSSITICPGPTNTLLRERLAGDANKQQDPGVVASIVTKILNQESQYINGDIVAIRDGKEKLHSKLD